MMSQIPLFGSSGDLGDCIASLAVVKAMHGGDYVLFDRPVSNRESMKGARYEALRPLLKAQPYLGSVWWDESPTPTHDFSTFRHDHKPGEDLASWQARHLGVTIDHSPWLTAFRSPKSLGRVVIARSFRYQNLEFPWKRFVAKYRKEVLFVGLPDEHRSFQVSNGCIVEYCPTGNLLELAEVIAGADLFIGNQSAPFWIAAGLGVNLIQETFPPIQNSIIKRPNAKYLIRPPFNV